jgi:AraC family transcriptional regulator
MRSDRATGVESGAAGDVKGVVVMDIARNIQPGTTPCFHDLALAVTPGELGPQRGPVLRQRYRGASVSLYEWQCGGHGPAHPAEEWSDAHEVVIPRRGAFEWLSGGERHLADPGTATFFHPDESYRVRHPLPGGDAGGVFRLTASGARALLEEHDPAASDRPAVRFPASHVRLDGRAYLLHRLALRAASHGAEAVEVEERAVAFLRAAVRHAHGHRRMAVSPRRAAEYAARVSEVVAARYRERLTLTSIAAEVGVSAFHLSRLVTAATGVPIYRMIVRRRLRDALELLLETKEGISRIALAVGFASHSHLTEAFRREYGMPPRAVRSGLKAARR